MSAAQAGVPATAMTLRDLALTLSILLGLAGPCAGQVPFATAVAPAPSERRMETLMARLQKNPADAPGLAELAAAYMDRARATADISWYARAEAACARSLEAAPGNYEALRLRAWILAGEHRFVEAEGAARRAIARRPRDPWNYGTLGDALIEMGDYDGATDAFQKMVDLRPDTASYARGAYLRELLGDTDGAMALMGRAASSADPFDPEKGAWCLAQLASLKFSRGDLQGAAFDYERARVLSPESYLPLAGLARVRAALGRLEEAADLYARALAAAPFPAIAAEYGDLLARLGRNAEARRQYDLVEAIGRIQKGATGLFDRQVAMFRADHDLDPEGALDATERELVTRKDIYGYDAVAWCALKAGRIGRARGAMALALRLGTRDAVLHYHAGMIALAAGSRAEAALELRRALRINPHFDLAGAEKARGTLRALCAPAGDGG